MSRPRLTDAAGAILALGAVGVAEILQGAWGLQPCTMCIVQRYAFLLLAGVFLARAVAGYRMAFASSLALTAVALVGVLASARIDWALKHPGGSCGRDALANFLNDLPTAQRWPALFEATGICGDKVPPVLGVQFHNWSLLLFCVMVCLAWMTAKPQR